MVWSQLNLSINTFISLGKRSDKRRRWRSWSISCRSFASRKLFLRQTTLRILNFSDSIFSLHVFFIKIVRRLPGSIVRHNPFIKKRHLLDIIQVFLLKITCQTTNQPICLLVRPPTLSLRWSPLSLSLSLLFYLFIHCHRRILSPAVHVIEQSRKLRKVELATVSFTVRGALFVAVLDRFLHSHTVLFIVNLWQWEIHRISNDLLSLCLILSSVELSCD